jgi:hypothetical protein
VVVYPGNQEGIWPKILANASINTTLLVGSDPVTIEIPFEDYVTNEWDTMRGGPLSWGADGHGVVYARLLGTEGWDVVQLWRPFTVKLNPSRCATIRGAFILGNQPPGGGTPAIYVNILDAATDQLIPDFELTGNGQQNVHAVKVRYNGITWIPDGLEPWLNKGPPPTATLRVQGERANYLHGHVDPKIVDDELVEVTQDPGPHTLPGTYAVPDIMQYRMYPSGWPVYPIWDPWDGSAG